MSQEYIPPFSRSLPPTKDHSGDDSDDFQDLEDQINESRRTSPKLKQTKAQTKTFWDEEDSNKDQILQQMKGEIANLKNKVKFQQHTIQQLKSENLDFSSQYKSCQSEIESIKNQLSSSDKENQLLKNSNKEIKQTIETLKSQKAKFTDKINCLQQKLQLEKDQNEIKFKLIKQKEQTLQKIQTESISNQNIVKILNAKLQAMTKVLLKIDDVWSILTVSKKQNSINAEQQSDEKIAKLHKIKDILFKQQTKINQYKESLSKLQKSNQINQDSAHTISSGISKWLDPVMKFCNIENGKEGEKIEKKSKNNASQ